MSKAQQTLAQAFLERVSRGAVPMGGFYWVDPKALRSQSTDAEATAEALAPKVQRTSATAARASATTDARAPVALPASATGRSSATAARASATGQPATTAWQPGAMASQPSAIAWRAVALAQRIGLFLIGAHASIREPGETVSTGCTQHVRGERA